MCSINKNISFDEINIGDRAQFTVEVNEEKHGMFSELVGDFSPIHCNDDFSSNTKFGKRIGYAFLLTGFLSRLYGEYMPGGSSVCIKQGSEFINPFYIGDKIKVIGEVVNKIESTKFIEIKTEMFRNDTEQVFRGMGIVQVLFESRLFKPLYEVSGKKIYYADFVNALGEAGINNGDAVFVHSDISVFGKLAATDSMFLFEALCDAIKDSAGEDGTVIMPAFSYSFCKNEIYDLKSTRSTVGTLTEHFRKQPDVDRTLHPIFSVAVRGKCRDDVLDISKDSFDSESVFGKLHRMKGKLLFLGAPFQSCTYLHYIEQKFGVPYRFIKTFKGEIHDGVRTYKDECTFFVRDMEKDDFCDTSRLEKYLIKNGFMKEVILGAGRILMIEAETLFDECWKLLEKDINYLLKESKK